MSRLKVKHSNPEGLFDSRVLVKWLQLAVMQRQYISVDKMLLTLRTINRSGQFRTANKTSFRKY